MPPKLPPRPPPLPRDVDFDEPRLGLLPPIEGREPVPRLTDGLDVPRFGVNVLLGFRCVVVLVVRLFPPKLKPLLFPLLGRAVVRVLLSRLFLKPLRCPLNVIPGRFLSVLGRCGLLPGFLPGLFPWNPE